MLDSLRCECLSHPSEVGFFPKNCLLQNLGNSNMFEAVLFPIQLIDVDRTEKVDILRERAGIENWEGVTKDSTSSNFIPFCKFHVRSNTGC